MPQRLFFCVLVIWGGFGAGCSSRPAPDTGVLRVAINREPTTFNSLLAADVTTQIVTDQLHAPLIRLNQETQEMEPALAESWEFSEDGKTLVFRLKRGLRFSDGEPFDGGGRRVHVPCLERSRSRESPRGHRSDRRRADRGRAHR